MLTSQVSYWNLMETKRHNYEAEQAAYAQAEAARKQAEAALRNADTNAYNAAINKLNADTNAKNAQTALYSAQVNERLGWANYDVNKQLALSNIGLNSSQKALNESSAALTQEKTKTQVHTTSLEEAKATLEPSQIWANIDLTQQKTKESKATAKQGWINAISNAVRSVSSIFAPLGGTK